MPWRIIIIQKYSWPLNNTGLKRAGPLLCTNTHDLTKKKKIQIQRDIGISREKTGMILIEKTSFKETNSTKEDYAVNGIRVR